MYEDPYAKEQQRSAVRYASELSSRRVPLKQLKPCHHAVGTSYFSDCPACRGYGAFGAADVAIGGRRSDGLWQKLGRYPQNTIGISREYR